MIILSKLKRSYKNRVFSGVCGGIGEYFNIDPTVIRIAWVLISLRSLGTSFIIYLVSSFLIPEDDGIIYEEEYDRDNNEKFRRNTPIFIGLGLILWGAVLMANVFFPWLNIRIRHLWTYWPILLILLGLYILFSQRDN